MFKSLIRIRLEDSFDTFTYELEYLPQKGDLICFGHHDTLYEVDKILHNFYEFKREHHVELLVHPFKS